MRSTHSETKARETISRFGRVVVTGGSSGIGWSFIERVGRLSSNLTIFNLSRKKPPPFTNGQAPRHLKCDLSRPAERKAVFSRLLATLEGLDDQRPLLLVNNAGFGLYGETRDHSAAESLALLETNIAALVELTLVLMPELIRRKGAVVNIASTAAFQATPHLATYGASKAFVLNWTLALGEELRPSGVQALALCPGPTSTEFFRRAGIGESASQPFYGQTSDEVVDTLLKALGRRQRYAVSGLANRILAHISSRLPKGLSARITAKAIGRYRQTKSKEPRNGEAK